MKNSTNEIASKNDIINYFQDGCKKVNQLNIGVEHEKFIFQKKPNQRVNFQTISKVFDYFKNNDVNAYVSYGMTETSSGVCGYFIRDVKNFNHGFLGFAHKNTRMTINGGHIEIQSNTVMKGYINNKKCNGKFLTQDLGVMKSNQLFHAMAIHSHSADR